MSGLDTVHIKSLFYDLQNLKQTKEELIQFVHAPYEHLKPIMGIYDGNQERWIVQHVVKQVPLKVVNLLTQKTEEGSFLPIGKQVVMRFYEKIDLWHDVIVCWFCELGNIKPYFTIEIFENENQYEKILEEGGINNVAP
jgi:hypothetical protein